MADQCRGGQRSQALQGGNCSGPAADDGGGNRGRGLEQEGSNASSSLQGDDE